MTTPVRNADEAASDAAGGTVAPIGILTLVTHHPLLQGNVQVAASFDDPVLYGEVEPPAGSSLFTGDPAVLPPLLAAARALERQGVSAIAGACGSFAHYQLPVAAAVGVPVFLSPMLLVPMLQRSLGARRKLGIIAAWTSALTDNVYQQCGIVDRESLVLRQAGGGHAFDTMLDGTAPFDPEALAAELVALARDMVAEEPALGALLLQCSDLPPFAARIQAATQLPVFDMTQLIRWLQSALRCRPYAGGLTPCAGTAPR